MKLRNRIMSWILSPGAYALWHSMGNPEEWEERHEHYTWYLHHKTADVWLISGKAWIPPFRAIIGSFHFQGSDRFGTGKCLGYFERHFVYPQARWLLRRLAYLKKTKAYRQANQNLFTKLTVNQTSEVK